MRHRAYSYLLRVVARPPQPVMHSIQESVVKRYQALVEGVFDGPAVVREPLLESEDGCVEISAKGKSAETQFELSEIGELMGQAVSRLEFLQLPDGVIKFAFISFILGIGLSGICVMGVVSMRHV